MSQSLQKRAKNELVIFTNNEEDELLKEYVYSRTIKQLGPRLSKLSIDLRKKIVKSKIKQAKERQHGYYNIIDVIHTDIELVLLFIDEIKDLHDTQTIMIRRLGQTSSLIFEKALDITTIESHQITDYVPPTVKSFCIAIRHPKVNITTSGFISYIKTILTGWQVKQEDVKYITYFLQYCDLSLVEGAVGLMARRTISCWHDRYDDRIRFAITLQFPGVRYNKSNWVITRSNLIEMYKYMQTLMQKKIRLFMLICIRARNNKNTHSISKDIEHMILNMYVEKHLNNKKVL